MTVRVTVLLADDHEPAQMLDALQRAGLRDPTRLTVLGVVTGAVEEAQVDALSQIEGVVAVDRVRDVHL